MPSMTRGDWIGFTFNGVHSSELGFIRISDGSRFNETILPTMKDTTVQVPGENGMYYFGSYYTQKTFSFNIAFDSMTEENFKDIRRIFGDGQVHDLILDEAPYKVYSVKVSSPPQLKYICFDEGGQRIYKGEGTIQFIAYYPFARGRWTPNTQLIDHIGTLAYSNTVFCLKGHNLTEGVAAVGDKHLYVGGIGFIYIYTSTRKVGIDTIGRSYDVYEKMKNLYPIPNFAPFSAENLGNAETIWFSYDVIKDYLIGKPVYTIKSGVSSEEVHNYFDWKNAYPVLKNTSNVLPNRGSIKTNFLDYSGYQVTGSGVKRVYVTTAPYNLGDIDTDFILNVGLRHNGNQVKYIKIELLINDIIKKELLINNIENGQNKTFQIDTKKRLVLQYDQDSNNKDNTDVYGFTGEGIIRNNWISSGDFFKIPANTNDEIRLKIYVGYKSSSSITDNKTLIQQHYPFDWDIQYNYLYY